MRRIPHVRAGDPITADLFNEVSERLERFANLSTSSPYILLDDSPNGKSIALALPQQTWALLSGASSPYSFTEVRDGPGGTWVSMPNGDSGTANVYEANGKSGLAGKVVPITWTAAGDWRFQWVGYGTPTYTWTFNVSGCTSALAGSIIELYQSGVLIDSCTTGDGTGGTTLGQCVLTVPGGTYDVIITGPAGAGFDPTNATLTISATKTTNTTLAVDSNHDCWSCCNYPIPHELHATDSDGAIVLPLSYDAFGRPAYILSTTSPVATACDSGPFQICINCVTPAVTTKLYSIGLLPGCTATMAVAWHVNSCGGVDHYNATLSASPTNVITPITVNAANCSPMNLVFTLPTTIPGSSLAVPGGGGVIAFTA